jgi:hypothetical protein
MRGERIGYAEKILSRMRSAFSQVVLAQKSAPGLVWRKNM